jgi:hypothetical protein
MITLLASAILSCSEAAWIIQGIRAADLSSATRADMVLSVLESTDSGCDLDSALEAESRR